jgi:hypothetical protein
MASYDQVREAILARPFQPFVVRLMDGRHFTANHPESVAVGQPGMDMLFVATDGVWHYIDVPNIVSLEMGPVQAKPASGNGNQGA